MTELTSTRASSPIGLAAAIESLGRRLATVEGMEVDVRVDVAGRLDPELETTVYRIVQEALSNIAEHARAERVGVRIEVSDDGQGFNPAARAEGFGLVGMRERVALAQGRLDIESSSEGTVVTARLPAR